MFNIFLERLKNTLLSFIFFCYCERVEKAVVGLDNFVVKNLFSRANNIFPTHPTFLNILHLHTGKSQIEIRLLDRSRSGKPGPLALLVLCVAWQDSAPLPARRADWSGLCGVKQIICSWLMKRLHPGTPRPKNIHRSGQVCSRQAIWYTDIPEG